MSKTLDQLSKAAGDRFITNWRGVTWDEKGEAKLSRGNCRDIYSKGFYEATAELQAQLTLCAEQLSITNMDRDLLRGEVEDLKGKVKEDQRIYMEFYDKHHGTPCEEIRHREEVESLKAKIERMIPPPQ